MATSIGSAGRCSDHLYTCMFYSSASSDPPRPLFSSTNASRVSAAKAVPPLHSHAHLPSLASLNPIPSPFMDPMLDNMAYASAWTMLFFFNRSDGHEALVCAPPMAEHTSYCSRFSWFATVATKQTGADVRRREGFVVYRSSSSRTWRPGRTEERADRAVATMSCSMYVCDGVVAADGEMERVGS